MGLWRSILSVITAWNSDLAVVQLSIFQTCVFCALVCSVVIWDIARKEAVCGSQAAMQSAGPVYTLAFSRHRDDILVTGGE